ncbi:MAG: glycerophosphodiester phosphodiesterase [Anaerolineaceae bacterium]
MLREKIPVPLIIAHRGASTLAPENTLAAFRLAYQLGADGIELDVMLSADNELVVIHDDSVNRTTNGSGKVAKMPFAALRELDAGSNFSQAFRGEKLPNLSEVFEELGGKLLINVELKNYSHPFDALTKDVINLVERFHLEETVLLSSFNPINLSKARRLNPAIQLGLLTSPGSKLMQGAVGRLFPYDALHPYFADISEAMVEKLHGLGKKVNTWTVDDPQALRHMQSCGVDAVICNNPAAVRTLLEGQA